MSLYFGLVAVGGELVDTNVISASELHCAPAPALAIGSMVPFNASDNSSVSIAEIAFSVVRVTKLDGVVDTVYVDVPSSTPFTYYSIVNATVVPTLERFDPSFASPGGNR